MASKQIFSLGAVSVLTLGLCGFVGFPVFAEGPVDISIVELVDDGGGTYRPWEDITGAMPGETYSAIPRVQNNGPATVSVRMCLSESATSPTGESLSLPAHTFELDINSHWVVDDASGANATDPAAGNCYKYDSALVTGALTEPLFTAVTLSPALRNEHQGATFSLHLEAIAVEDSQDSPSSPVEPSSQPGRPDTGAATATESFNAANTILYALGAAALIVLAIHLVRNHKRP